MDVHASLRTKKVEVAIVSQNPETLDGLQAYLSAAGVVASCSRDLENCAAASLPHALAFVLFPDDYRWESVVAALAELRERRPRSLPVLVTSHPNRFEGLLGKGSVLVVPRPVWGWTILEAIRVHLVREEAADGGA
jgi:DNA-binding response OmpR family regulator